MRKEELFHIIGELDEQKVFNAERYIIPDAGTIRNPDKKTFIEGHKPSRAKNSSSWFKWGLAACMCLVVAAVVILPFDKGVTNENVAHIYTLDSAARMTVELLEWQDEGFKAIVTDIGNNSVFPLDANLTVFFEDETKIVLNNGLFFDYDSEEPAAGKIGWEPGTSVHVEFLNYQAYSDDSGYNNRVYASVVRIEQDIK